MRTNDTTCVCADRRARTNGDCARLRFRYLNDGKVFIIGWQREKRPIINTISGAQSRGDR